MIKEVNLTKKIPIWRDERMLKAAAQIISSLIVFGFLYWVIDNFLEITQQRYPENYSKVKSSTLLSNYLIP